MRDGDDGENGCDDSVEPPDVPKALATEATQHFSSVWTCERIATVCIIIIIIICDETKVKVLEKSI